MSTEEYVYSKICCYRSLTWVFRNSATPQPEAQPPTEPAAMAATTTNRKRPRLDMNTDARERKRGKSMFGLVLGTLNKAKNEDKERNASEAVSVWFG